MTIKEFLKKHKWRIRLIVGAFIFIIGLIVIIIFMCMAQPTSEIKRNDWLTFLGAYLAFSATIALSALALWQNKRFKEENDSAQDKLIQATEKLKEANEFIAKNYQKQVEINDSLFKMQRNKDMPFIKLNEVHIDPISDNEFKLSCTYENIGKNISTITKFWIPKFYKNSIAYNESKPIDLFPTCGAGSKRLFMPCDTKETFEYVFDGFRATELNNHYCLFMIFTIDLNFIQRTNHILTKIELGDKGYYFEIIKYSVAESKEQIT
jgi:membrane protein implicated in regulation of membrane protease activity